jgi:O-antigen/teichoic acid export membrane protein
MTLSFVSPIVSFFKLGHERTLKAKQNILASAVIKGMSIAINFMLIPLTIHFINPTQYGIWITLSSIITWLNFFDIGLGHGLRNRFAEAKAKGEKRLARVYVSTTYAILSIIIAILIAIFASINPWLNWAKILNAPLVMAKELGNLALIVVVFFGLQFVLNLIVVIVTADQRPAKASLLVLLGNIISLSGIFILMKTAHRTLLMMGLILSAAPVLVLAVMSFWYFKTGYREYAPSLKLVNFRYAKSLLSLGTKFFVIQIAVVILFQTANIIISQIFGPQEVTPYNVAFRYFSVLIMVFSIIMTPFWSAFTDAYSRGDGAWVRHIMKKLNILSIIFGVTIFFMVLVSPFVYRIWVGPSVRVRFLLSVFMGIYSLILIIGTPYTTFLNGVGKIKLSLWIAILVAPLNIPLAIFLATHTSLGIVGVIASICVCNSPILFYGPIQYKKIMSGHACGIWGQ